MIKIPSTLILILHVHSNGSIWISDAPSSVAIVKRLSKILITALVLIASLRSVIYLFVISFSEQEKNTIVLACLYDFFKWTDGNFYPDAYVTKANSLVALVRGLSPAREFPIEQPYRTPYVNVAYAEWITKRESWPYLMYLITKYELMLQLHRVHERKK